MKILFLSFVLTSTILAQTTNAPIIYKLTPEESQAYAKIQQQKQAVIDEANRQIRELTKDEAILLLSSSAKIPKEELARKATLEGDHFVFYPSPSSSPK